MLPWAKMCRYFFNVVLNYWHYLTERSSRLGPFLSQNIIFFSYLSMKTCCGYSSEVPYGDISNEYDNMSFHGEVTDMFIQIPLISGGMTETIYFENPQNVFLREVRDMPQCEKMYFRACSQQTLRSVYTTIQSDLSFPFWAEEAMYPWLPIECPAKTDQIAGMNRLIYP